MMHKSFATAAQFGVLAFLLTLLLFSDGDTRSSSGLIGFTFREVATAFRDSETQWVVFLCLGIYFTAFFFISSRVNSNSPKLSESESSRAIPFPSWCLHAKADVYGVRCRAFWLACALLISAVIYAFDYSSSTQALAFLGGAVLGQGGGLLKSGKRKAESGNTFTTLVVVILIILLALASVWNVDSGHTFEYRSHTRLSGPWDNPNTFGLLVGVGMVLAGGMIVSSFKFQVSGEERSWKLEVRKCAIIILCLIAAGLMARGLVHSYSRGAWAASICGLAYLAVNWFRVSGFGLKRRSEDGQTHLTLNLSQPMDEGVHQELSTLNFKLSTRLRRNGLPILVILVSVLLMSFWHLRQTEWHPVRRALSAVNTVDFSWRNRIVAWAGALQIIAEHPWFGAGWNQPEPLYEHYYLPPKLQEAAVIEMNDYLMLGATLGIPALFCFGMYLWFSLTGKLEMSELDWLQTTCRAGAIVLLIGFWFDGGLFKLPTAATFWILLELGSVSNRELREIHKND